MQRKEMDQMGRIIVIDRGKGDFKTKTNQIKLIERTLLLNGFVFVINNIEEIFTFWDFVSLEILLIQKSNSLNSGK